MHWYRREIMDHCKLCHDTLIKTDYGWAHMHIIANHPATPRRFQAHELTTVTRPDTQEFFNRVMKDNQLVD